MEKKRVWLDALFASTNGSFKMLVYFVLFCFYGIPNPTIPQHRSIKKNMKAKILVFTISYTTIHGTTMGPFGLSLLLLKTEN